jgi:hypothetical protein
LKKKSSEGIMPSMSMLISMPRMLVVLLSLAMSLLLLPNEQGRALAVPLEEKRYLQLKR